LLWVCSTFISGERRLLILEQRRTAARQLAAVPADLAWSRSRHQKSRINRNGCSTLPFLSGERIGGHSPFRSHRNWTSSAVIALGGRLSGPRPLVGSKPCGSRMQRRENTPRSMIGRAK
jgi:hypothetical protein